MTAPSPRSQLIRQVVIPPNCVCHRRQHQSWRPLISRQGGLIPRPGGIVVGGVKALGMGLILPEATIVGAAKVLKIGQVLPEATEAIVRAVDEGPIVGAVILVELRPQILRIFVAIHSGSPRSRRSCAVTTWPREPASMGTSATTPTVKTTSNSRPCWSSTMVGSLTLRSIVPGSASRGLLPDHAPSNNVVEVSMILESLGLKCTGFHMPRWTTIKSLRVGTSINAIISVWHQYTTALLSTGMFLLPGGRRIEWRLWQPGNISIPTFATSHLIPCPVLESLRSLYGFTWPSR